MVRRAEENDRAQQMQPVVPRRFGVVARTTRHQAAHAVRQNHQFAYLHRPGVQQGFDLVREFARVAADRQTRVVVQIDWGEAFLGGECGAVVMAVSMPLPIVHAQPVDEQQHFARGVGNCSFQTSTWVVPMRYIERRSGAAPLHAYGEWIAAGLQMIAEHAIQGGDHGIGCAEETLPPSNRSSGRSAASIAPPTARVTPRTHR